MKARNQARLRNKRGWNLVPRITKTWYTTGQVWPKQGSKGVYSPPTVKYFDRQRHIYNRRHRQAAFYDSHTRCCIVGQLIIYSEHILVFNIKLASMPLCHVKISYGFPVSFWRHCGPSAQIPQALQREHVYLGNKVWTEKLMCAADIGISINR